MRGEVLFMMLIAVLGGAMMASQGAINALLAKRLEHPLQSAVVSFAVGSVALVVVCLLMRVGTPAWSSLAEMPWYLWTGGLIGAVFVTAMIILTPRLGSSVTISCVIAGQIFASVILDHFGLLGLPTIRINAERIIGIVLLIAGVFLIRR